MAVDPQDIDEKLAENAADPPQDQSEIPMAERIAARLDEQFPDGPQDMSERLRERGIAMTPDTYRELSQRPGALKQFVAGTAVGLASQLSGPGASIALRRSLTEHG